MTVKFLQNGFGAATGSQLALAKNILCDLDGAGDGKIIYCSSELGTDAAWPRGSNEEYPVATLAQAITNADEGGVILVAADHDEELVSTVTPLSYQTIVGFGRSQGKPTAKIRMGLAGETSGLLAISNPGVLMSNIYLPAKTTENTARARIAVSDNFFRLEDCYGESGDDDTLTAIVEYLADADYGSHIIDCEFVSTATAKATAPAPAIMDTGTDTDFYIKNLTLDGGLFGYGYGLAPATMPCAMFRSHSATTQRMLGVTLLRGADIVMAGGPQGYVNLVRATGGAKVVWG